MALLQREQIPPCDALPEEEVTLPSLGGSVLVRGLTLPALLDFSDKQRAIAAPRPGETSQQAEQRSNIEATALLLSLCALAADGLPVYTAEQWGNFGASHLSEFSTAGAVALRLCGLGGEAGNP